MKDCEVIKLFVEFLRDKYFPNIKIDDWPDKSNSKTPDIDALAGPFAIEHTSIDTLPNQRQKDHWFVDVVKGLEEELSPRIEYRLSITVPYNFFLTTDNNKGRNKIREVLKTWILIHSAMLREGYHKQVEITGIPFDIIVWKDSNRSPKLVFSRTTPNDQSFPDRIKDLFRRKIDKLTSYGNLGKTTILLVENDDIALLNEAMLIGAIQCAYPAGLPASLSQLWYADTSIPSDVEFVDLTTFLNHKSH